jgi:hypothetical protein
VLNDEAADYLASWSPDTVDEWNDASQAIATQIVDDFADHPSWRPVQGGAVGSLLSLRRRALEARSPSAAASVYYYWYVPL